MAGAGAAASLGLALAACGDDEDSKGSEAGSNDLAVVNYALTLEYLEADFYDAVVKDGVLDGKEQSLGRRIRDNEHAHVDALVAAAKKLGEPVARPTTDFKAVLGGGRRRVLRTAAELENTGAAAYLGAAPSISSREVLASALSIHSVEGRHAAVLNRIVGRSFLPDGALATPMTMTQVMSKLEPFLG